MDRWKSLACSVQRCREKPHHPPTSTIAMTSEASKESSVRVKGEKDTDCSASVAEAMPAGTNPMPVASSDPSTSAVEDKTGSGDPNAPGTGTLGPSPLQGTAASQFPTFSERHPDRASPYPPELPTSKASGEPERAHVEHGPGNLDDEGRSDDGTIRTGSWNPKGKGKGEVADLAVAAHRAGDGGAGASGAFPRSAQRNPAQSPATAHRDAFPKRGIPIRAVPLLNRRRSPAVTRPTPAPAPALRTAAPDPRMEMDIDVAPAAGDAPAAQNGASRLPKARSAPSFSHLTHFQIPLPAPAPGRPPQSSRLASDAYDEGAPFAPDGPATPILEPTTVSISNHFLEISKDRLSVKYVGKGNHTYDVGVIRANRPFSSRHQSVGYFEAKILDAGARCQISVGLSTKDFTLCKHPGSDGNSYGFGDGRKSHDGRGEPFGGKLAAGDTVGCGLVFEKMQVFFTLNGKHLGVAFRGVRPASWYPSVGLHSPGEHVSVNFGSSSFLFDIDGFVEDERRQKLAQLARIPVDIPGLHHLIRNYLLHNAYESTYTSFTSASRAPPDTAAEGNRANGHRAPADGDADEAMPDAPRGPDPSAMLFSLHRRAAIRRAVLAGRIADARTAALRDFPGIERLPIYPRLRLLLLCQEFVEAVKAGGDARDDACIAMMTGGGMAEYWREEERAASGTKRPRTEKEGRGEREEERRLLMDVASLMAYEEPGRSPQAWLLDDAQRERVADALNTAILASLDPPSHAVYPISSLELFARQLVVTRTLLREGFNIPPPPILSTPSPQGPPSPAASPAPPAAAVLSASPVSQRGWLSNLLVASPLPLAPPAGGPPREAQPPEPPERLEVGPRRATPEGGRYSEDELEGILNEVA
ncbi:hypothetical protein DFJ74DRAFT_754660 [Hyaloraphidium curvatum]|nr:hypothetical protein DFJ74DRAFT_754660 [Hyaloraphidium curvatum]